MKSPFFILLLLMLVSCSHEPATQTPNTTVNEFDGNLTATSTIFPTTDQPLHPEIKEADCSQNNATGYILFLSSSNDLHIMDGNGCKSKIVMRRVSGSPDWSVDGKYIAVGCEENKFICILDATRTLESCFSSSDQDKCTPSVIKKINLPYDAEQPKILNTSWSFDGEKILVGIASLGVGNIYLLDINDSGTWKLVIKKTNRFGDMSPVKDEIIFDGIEKMPLDLNNGYIESYHIGESPQWSPDGKSIVFIFKIKQHNNYSFEPYGIMQWTFDAKPPWKLLYDPSRINSEGRATHNIMINHQAWRVLSWSPDSRYIAFVGDYRYKDDAQIFRLNTETGEVVVLTTKISQEQNQTKFFAPAWGP